MQELGNFIYQSGRNCLHLPVQWSGPSGVEGIVYAPLSDSPLSEEPVSQVQPLGQWREARPARALEHHAPSGDMALSLWLWVWWLPPMPLVATSSVALVQRRRRER